MEATVSEPKLQVAAGPPPAGPADSPNYLVVYFTLLGFLGVSFLLGLMDVPFLATAAILAIAAVKAVLVAWYYMNLRSEPRFIAFIVLGGLLGTLILLGLLVPDLVFYHLWGWMGRPQ